MDVDGGQIRIREYIPNDFVANNHSMLFFHGGGFSIGSIRTQDPVCKFFAKYRLENFSVEYRLHLKIDSPIPLEDCDKSMDWLIENADQI